eukprot:3531104-Ditylum_brightwellii.AAC.1
MPIVFLLNWTAEKWRQPIPPANLDPKAMAWGKLRWYLRHGSKTGRSRLWNPENSTAVNDVQAREYVILMMRTVI